LYLGGSRLEPQLFLVFWLRFLQFSFILTRWSFIIILPSQLKFY